MKTLIVGLGTSGRAAYDLLKREGDEVAGVDDDETKTIDRNPNVASFDRIVISPGIPPTNRYYQEALQLGKEIIGEAELALCRIHQPCVAITGTNGKTTVTLLIEHVLKAGGKKARALGNVGTPLTSYLKESSPDEIVVAELSSFQLETLKTAVFDVTVILNITPDHLDRYSSMEEYAKAKCHLQKLTKGTCWVHQDVAEEFGSLLAPGYQTYGSDPRCAASTDRAALKVGEMVETVLPIRYRKWGKHESENVLAAWVVCRHFEIAPEVFLTALETFRKPAHRIEFVGTFDGVDYFNDSKGTNIDATMKAVERMTGQVVLIAGGVDKGASYQPWKKCFEGRVKDVIAIGEAAPKILEELKPEYRVIIVSTLKEAIELAQSLAKSGENILLSPGCSSYDMFRDYVHRGEEFKRIIQTRS
jgi:UDP-N-acetylmuramoylalanine--D-glutamate ligase